MPEHYGLSMLSSTPLHDRHTEAGAKMADFGGWDMPIEYTGTVAEHTAVRESVGIFDVSHMGKIAIHGPGAAAFINSVVANDLDRIGDGQAQYSMLCNEAGGVVDDLIVYKWNDDAVYIVPNAANSATVVREIMNAAPAGITVDDQQLTHGIIAVQGPKSADVVNALGLPIDMDYMAFTMGQWRDAPVTVCRSGYTGELGFELIAPNDVLVELWDALLVSAQSHGGGPAGLGARDTLRTEMGYPLHGQDISASISPVEAMLSWAIGWNKPAFIGREALVAQREAGPKRRLRAIKAKQRAIPRSHMEIYDSSGASIGEVTSGTFSPTLKEGIALALLDASAGIGDEVLVDVRGKQVPFEVVKAPFVPSHVR
jgi:aminomethyltransferase